MTSRRKPFDLPSGCGRVSVPSFTVPSLCSMPPITIPKISPKPIVFNIPEVPNVPIEQACIDIIPSLFINYAPISVPSGPSVVTRRNVFRTASGFDDCLEGRYELNMAFTLPCVLKSFPDDVKASGKWNKKENPEAEIKFKRPKKPTCAFDNVEFNLEIPCPVTAFPNIRVVNRLMRGEQIGVMAIKKKSVGCGVESVSLELNVQAGCAGMTLAAAGKVSMGRKYAVPQMNISVKRGNKNKISGKNPDACKFDLGVNLKLPYIWGGKCTLPSGATATANIITAFDFSRNARQVVRFNKHMRYITAVPTWVTEPCELDSISMFLNMPAGCNAGKYKVTPKLSMMTESGPKISGQVTKADGADPNGCSFNLSLLLALGTGALVNCPRINPRDMLVAEYSHQSVPSLHFGFTRPSSVSNCDLEFSFVLDLPKILLNADFNVNLGDVDINIDNGIDINNIRNLTIDLKLPKLICMPREVLTISRVQMKFFKDNHIKNRVWRHVTQPTAKCVRKKVRKYPKKVSAKPEYTWTCITQCSREIIASVKLPWWLYRAENKGKKREIIPVKRINKPAGSKEEGLYLVASIPPNSDGDGELWGDLQLGCEEPNIEIKSDTLNVGVEKVGECFRRVNVNVSGLSGEFTRVVSMYADKYGIHAVKVIESYRKGILKSRKSGEDKVLVGFQACK